MLKIDRKRMEARMFAVVRMHKTYNQRVCYWRQLRGINYPRLTYSQRVHKRIIATT